MIENGEDQAFPGVDHRWSQVHGNFQQYIPGLTKREYFAGQALQGILASQWYSDHIEKARKRVGTSFKEAAAITACNLADALLLALEKSPVTPAAKAAPRAHEIYNYVTSHHSSDAPIDEQAIADMLDKAIADSLRPYRDLAAKLRKLPADEWSAETCGAVARIADELEALIKEAGK